MVKTKSGWTVIKPRKDTFKCQDCKREFPVERKMGATGYAIYGGKKVCYACSAKRERRAISRVHPGGKYGFYLVKKDGKWYVTNWTGLISYPVTAISTGRHNMARTRIDVQFRDHLGREWYGSNIGDNQILRARRKK